MLTALGVLGVWVALQWWVPIGGMLQRSRRRTLPISAPWAALAKKKHAANRRHISALMSCYQPEGLQIGPPKTSNWCERLGSGSEVQRFRVQSRHRLLVIRFSASKAAQLVDQFTVGPPIGGADADVDASVQTLPPYVVRTNRAGIHLNGQNMASAPGDDLQLRHQPRHNVIADEVGQRNKLPRSEVPLGEGASGP